jgi:L-alanine-DL-glutamate epimerase-like enolase superfamily enzyme
VFFIFRKLYLRKNNAMELRLSTYQLPLKHPFRISRESTTVQETLIVSLTLGGQTGYGEATANEYYGTTAGTMSTEIERSRWEIESFPFTTPEVFHSFLSHRDLHNFSRCALDLAANDLFGKLQGKPLYEIWGYNPKSYPTTNYTVGIDSIEKMVAKMKEQPWPVYKIKLGTDEDVAIVQELRKHTDASFRIDANGAWNARETIENAAVLKKLGVEFIEQPLPAGDWQGMEKVFHYSELPVIADESCVIESDVARCALHFNGINIKLCKCGGLTPARRMIESARDMGLKVMVGCMTESTVGISAIAQLLPRLDYVDMDGAMLLARDIADGVVIGENGKIGFPEVGGSGIILWG